MDFSSVHKTLFDTFKYEFGVRQPDVPVGYENQPFDQPKGAPWAYITLVPGAVLRKEISSAQVMRAHGVVNVQLMVPQDKGTRKLHQMAEAVTKIFADRDFPLADGKITTCDVEIRNRGLMHGFHTFSVQASYQYDTRLQRNG
jgi:hypothetical protein